MILSSRRSRVLPLLAAGAALLAALLGPPGAPDARAGGRVAIQLTQILATDTSQGPKEIDPSLAELKSQLEKYNYRVFKKAGSEKKDVAEGEEAAFNLSSEPGFVLRVTPSGAGEHVTLALSLKDGQGKEVLGTRVKIKDGGTSIIGKELESKAGTLFLAFTVKRS